MIIYMYMSIYMSIYIYIYIYIKSHLINNGASSCSIFLFYRIKYVFLINLKYITVTWLFQMAKFKRVIFNCPFVDLLA